jgi:phosphohistidine phosphatase SixA
MQTRRELLRAGLGAGALLSIPALAAAQDSRPVAGDAKGAGSLVIYAVRHAEKASGRDPELTPEGSQRAEALARVLQHVELDHVYSTDTKRTRATGAPVAKAKGLEISSYKPFGSGLPKLLAGGEGGRTVLVVGHSNTVPALVKAFGLEPGVPVHPKHGPLLESYEDLFMIVATKGAKPFVQRLTYGAKSEAKGH